MTDSGLSRSASAFGPFHDVAFLRLLFFTNVWDYQCRLMIYFLPLLI